MKECSKCKETKEDSEFYKASPSERTKDGLKPQCKICMNIRYKKFRDNTLDIRKAVRKAHYHKNIDKMREQKRKDTIKYKDSKVEYDKIYRKENAERIAAYKKNWESLKGNEPVYKIKKNLRRRLHHVLKGNLKADKTFNLISCTAEEFKLYLESLFQEGMSWDNYSPSSWHVDHIIPCYKFDLTNEEEQRKCFHYTNQRPLWAKENLSRKRD